MESLETTCKGLVILRLPRATCAEHKVAFLRNISVWHPGSVKDAARYRYTGGVEGQQIVRVAQHKNVRRTVSYFFSSRTDMESNSSTGWGPTGSGSAVTAIGAGDAAWQ